MNREYDGAGVLDEAGEKIGHVERSYVDDTGNVRMVEVKIGSLFAKHRLVPAEAGDLGENGLQLPFSRDTIENSPDHGHIGDTIEANTLDEVQTYYSGQTSGKEESESTRMADPPSADEAEGVPAAVPVGSGGAGDTNSAQRDEPLVSPTASSTGAAEPEFGQIRDTGDVIEIPIVEEQLVKRRVVTEVLRVRKKDVVETQNVGGEVRREDVEVEKDGDPRVRGEDAVGRP
ncbi:MAG: DUF2382 domain-containing protein [Chloroflexota bacterium]|nr:MAG: hypothetical protein DLM70_17275 [Chloroflexota bacterium]